MPTQKLDASLDESGQDTRGRLFVVTVVISDQQYLQLITLCETYEQVSKKGRSKWHGTGSQARLEFMRMVIEDSRFQGALCYSRCQNRLKPDFDAFTVDALANVIRTKLTGSRYVVEAWVDGLSEAKRAEYANTLRRKGLRNVHLHRVHKEEGNTLIRLADALAGLLRDAIEGKSSEAVRLALRGRQNGNIVEL